MMHLCENITIHEMKYSLLQVAKLVAANYAFWL